MRRSARLDAAAHHISSDPATFASLPLALAQRVFLALPVDARGRACCVCRAWRDALADPPLWSRLEMSGVRVGWRRLVTVLHGAADRARGQLCYLELSQEHVALDRLLPVLTANASSLRELHLYSVDASADYGVTVREVVAAAPLLQVLMAENVHCTWENASRVLRAEPPFALLQTRDSLHVQFDDQVIRFGGMERVGPFAAALADAALQPAVLRVCVQKADTALPAVMGALADAALARRLRELALQRCTPPAAVPLARLLSEGSLTSFAFTSRWPFGPPMLDAAGAALVAAALRVNTTVTVLKLSDAHLYRDMRAAGPLLGALVGHRSLRELWITGEWPDVDDRGAYGAALAALIAADSPALQVLVCEGLEDVGVAPIVEALPLNRHLHELSVGLNFISEAFARERLLPAVRANTTLRKLKCGWRSSPAVKEAAELVRRRRRRWQHG